MERRTERGRINPAAYLVLPFGSIEISLMIDESDRNGIPHKLINKSDYK